MKNNISSDIMVKHQRTSSEVLHGFVNDGKMQGAVVGAVQLRLVAVTFQLIALVNVSRNSAEAPV